MSATHTRDGEVCVVVHGRAVEVDSDSPAYLEYVDYVREVYGPIVELSRAQYEHRDGAEYTGWIEPRKFFATRPEPQ